MIPFISYREIDSGNRLCYYILQKAHPNYIGIISVSPLPDTLASVPIGDYNLYVNFHSTLQGNYVPSYKDVMQDIEGCVWQMANWFYTHRILTDKKKFSKFKIIKDNAHFSAEQGNT